MSLAARRCVTGSIACPLVLRNGDTCSREIMSTIGANNKPPEK